MLTVMNTMYVDGVNGQPEARHDSMHTENIAPHKIGRIPTPYVIENRLQTVEQDNSK
jgi:hypothetical protein